MKQPSENVHEGWQVQSGSDRSERNARLRELYWPAGTTSVRKGIRVNRVAPGPILRCAKCVRVLTSAVGSSFWCYMMFRSICVGLRRTHAVAQPARACPPVAMTGRSPFCHVIATPCGATSTFATRAFRQSSCRRSSISVTAASGSSPNRSADSSAISSN